MHDAYVGITPPCMAVQSVLAPCCCISAVVYYYIGIHSSPFLLHRLSTRCRCTHLLGGAWDTIYAACRRSHFIRFEPGTTSAKSLITPWPCPVVASSPSSSSSFESYICACSSQLRLHIYLEGGVYWFGLSIFIFMQESLEKSLSRPRSIGLVQRLHPFSFLLKVNAVYCETA